MPVIARFYGILIKMYFREHGVPHFHAIYGEFNGVFDVATLDMIEGDLPQRAQRLIRELAEQYKGELERMWKTQNCQKLPGLEWNMPKAKGYPKIRSVEPGPGKALRVMFDNGVEKEYDCTPLLQSEEFRPLQDDAIFRCAHADTHGYGVVWNDEIDLAESEIWLHGRNVEQSGAGDADGPRA